MDEEGRSQEPENVVAYWLSLFTCEVDIELYAESEDLPEVKKAGDGIEMSGWYTCMAQSVKTSPFSSGYDLRVHFQTPSSWRKFQHRNLGVVGHKHLVYSSFLLTFLAILFKLLYDSSFHHSLNVGIIHSFVNIPLLAFP